MGSFIDLTGKTFGYLTVIERVGKNSRGTEWKWRCKCICNNEIITEGRNLRGGRTKSCGCYKQISDKLPKGNVKDEIGNKYGHLTVVARAGSDKNGAAKWECECDCELKTHIIVLGNNLRRGHTTSCGCDRRSHGEKIVQSLLLNNEIPFEIEKRAFVFSSGVEARFDFYVDNSYFIEYDGETHYQHNLHGWHNEEQLKAQQERDVIKNQWCKDNNIPLIRIPYTHLSNLTIEDLKLETSKFII